MRKLFWVCSLILGSSALAFSQGPIQVGWAVITPTPTTTAVTTSGMVVFETFGLIRASETTQAGIVPPPLTANALLFVSTSGRLSRNIGVAIVNPQSSSVNVTLTLRGADGVQVASVTSTLPSHQQLSKFVTELFSGSSIPSDFTGTLTLTATAPVSIVGLRFRALNFSTIPITNLSPPGATVPTIATNVGGTDAILLPQFVTGGGWASQIVIVNTATTPLIVRLDLFKPDGTALTATLNGQTASSLTGLTIPAGGVLTISQRNPNGEDDF